ncbi:hypothetical protein ABGT15_04700 [Flavobacterium enshiense]|uniref:hypothetical protein n=1 Tax=Flavobacterium enshiense TaxID=1341165 RepID=UPI00345D0FEA
MNILKKIALTLAFSFTMMSCESTRTAAFDYHSYQETTAIKVELSNVMDKATAPYELHQTEVEALLLKIEKLKEYEKGKPNNQISFTLWEILTDKERNLISGFFIRWEAKKTLSPIFIEETKKQLLETLDLIIKYEITKDEASKNELLKIAE